MRTSPDTEDRMEKIEPAPGSRAAPPGESVTAVAYLRVSTASQAAEDRTSLADQRAAIERLAGQLGLRVGRWFEDPGASGATVEGRPGFSALLEACAAQPRPQRAPGTVLVLNASRFGRFDDPEEAAYWRVHLRKSGWHVRFAEGDAEGDAAPVVRAVQSMEASAYRRNLIANTRRGMKASATLGLWTREAPYGFRRQVVGSGCVLERGQPKAPNERVKLTPHEGEAQVVRWAFEAYAGGEHSLRSIADELHRRAPGRRWGVTVVNHLFRNEAYRGAVVGGRRRNGTPERYGCENSHPAIVPPRLWAAVLERLGRNARLGPGCRSTYLLSGLLRCPVCGEAYQGGGGGRSRNKRPARSHRRFYRDYGGILGTCPGRIGTVMRHLVDDAAVATIADTLSDPDVLRRMEQLANEGLADTRRRVKRAEAEARADLERLALKRARLIAAVEDDTLPAAAVRARLTEIDTAEAARRAALETLRFDGARARTARSEGRRLLEIAASFGTAAAKLEGSKLRRLLEPWLARATFDKRSRVLTLGIRPRPGLALYSLGVRGSR